MAAQPAIAQPDYLDVTELAGDDVSDEQITRLCTRYYWAGSYIEGKDAVELACGTGQGLGYLASKASTIIGSDVSAKMVAIARDYYGSRVRIDAMDAQNLPLEAKSLDAIILFEAIYYLSNAEEFAEECRRVLRPGGYVLIATANKDLFDFNPSPYTYKYYNAPELKRLFEARGFKVQCYGDTPVAKVSWRQKIFRPIKSFAVKWNLIPKTMGGKKLLKRLIFGRMEKMPREISASTRPYSPPPEIDCTRPNRDFKVILCAARLA